MPRFYFWYSETTTNKAYFDAENLDEAKAMMSAIENGETYIDDLSSFNSSTKDGNIDIEYSTLSEVK